MIKLFDNIDSVPKDDSDGAFWNMVDSDEVKSACLFQIRNEIQDDVGNMTDAQCRSALAKIQAYFNTIGFRDRVTFTINQAKAMAEAEAQEY